MQELTSKIGGQRTSKPLDSKKLGDFLIILNTYKFPELEIKRRLGGMKHPTFVAQKDQLVELGLVNRMNYIDFHKENRKYNPAGDFNARPNTKWAYFVTPKPLLSLAFYHNPKTHEEGKKFIEKYEPIFETLLFEYLKLLNLQRIIYKGKHAPMTIREIARDFPAYLVQNFEWFDAPQKRAIMHYLNGFLRASSPNIYNKRVLFNIFKKEGKTVKELDVPEKKMDIDFSSAFT